jgi:glycosyltransferase involved in cell wall biosynthesis
MSTERAPKVAYIASRYPDVSHTFIQREVAALRDLGVPVSTFAVRRSRPDQVLSVLDREELDRTYALLPPRRRDHLGAHLRVLRRRPGAWLRTLWGSLRRTPGDPRGTLWRVFYFAEAVVLWDRCERAGIRHVHAHFANVGSDVAQLASLLGRNLGDRWTWSFTMHGSTEFYDVRGARLPDKVGDALFVACVSDFTRSQLMLHADTAHWPKLRLVRCGVDPDSFRPAARGADRGRVRILCVSRLVRGKGADMLLEALRHLDAELVFVGDGPDRDRLEALARELHVADRTSFAGAVGQDEIRSHFGDADIFCLPSFAEGVPVVLMEAMASGLPVVTTAVAGVPELVEDGVSGLFVRPARSDDLRDALGRLAGDADLRRRMGEAGRHAVQTRFASGPSAESLRAIFAEVLSTDAVRVAHDEGRRTRAQTGPSRGRPRRRPTSSRASAPDTTPR